MTQSDAMNRDKRLYLDDLRVGQRFTSGTHVIDETQIKAFARQFDPQPFHLDDEAAKNTLFAGLAASGWHTAAITMRLLVETGLPLAGGIVGAGGEVSWPKPTRPIYATMHVLLVRDAFADASRSKRNASPSGGNVAKQNGNTRATWER